MRPNIATGKVPIGNARCNVSLRLCVQVLLVGELREFVTGSLALSVSVFNDDGFISW